MPRFYTKSKKRRIPSQLERRAVELGADELVALAEWTFHNRPRTLRNLRASYRRFCSVLLQKIEAGYDHA
jgi:hypothetical protein